MADDEVSAKILGIPINAKGVNGIGMAILAVSLGACMFLLYDRTQQSDAHLDAISKAHSIARDRQTDQLTNDHNAITHALETLGNSINDQNFIILSDEKQRREMKDKMDMPDSLRRKLNR